MQKNVKTDVEDDIGEKRMKMVEEREVNENSCVIKFNSLMQELIGTLIVQACEMSALVYRYYCVDGKTKKEISEIIHVPEDFIELMVSTTKVI